MLEARNDVLVFTSQPLSEPLEAIGPVSATIRLRASGEYADVFVRLCDVDPRGLSQNVCDGIQRVTPGRFPGPRYPDRSYTSSSSQPPIASRPDTRLRVQVSGGSFPRFARNTGTGEPLATATRLVCVDCEILRGSGITLSTLPDRAAARGCRPTLRN